MLRNYGQSKINEMDKFLHGDATREEKFWDQSRISSEEGKRSVGTNKDPFMAFERLYFIFSANSRISKLKTIAHLHRQSTKMKIDVI